MIARPMATRWRCRRQRTGLALEVRLQIEHARGLENPPADLLLGTFLVFKANPMLSATDRCGYKA
jgi:hypothetical protein